MNRVDPGRTFSDDTIRDIESYTHFVHSLTFGVEFIASIKIANHPENMYSRLKFFFVSFSEQLIQDFPAIINVKNLMRERVKLELDSS